MVSELKKIAPEVIVSEACLNRETGVDMHKRSVRGNDLHPRFRTRFRSWQSVEVEATVPEGMPLAGGHGTGVAAPLS